MLAVSILKRMVATAFATSLCCLVLTGVIHTTNPGGSDVLMFYFLFNVLFATLCAVTPINTLGDPFDVKFHQHEASSGIPQSAEAIARILIDMIIMLPLPVRV